MAKIATIVFLEGDVETRSPTEYTECIRYKFVGHPPLDVPIDFPEPVMTQAAAHGLKQKISDSYADVKGDINLARGMVESMVERLSQGVWNQTGEGVAKESLLAHALAEVTGKELSVVITTLAEKSKEERAALRKHKQIKPVLLRLEKERTEQRLKDAEAAAEGATPLDF